MGRAPCCDKTSVKRGPWSPEEDNKLKAYIDQIGTGGNWIALPQKIGLKRCGKSCRLRWLNYLRPNIKHGGFSEEEDNIICGLFLSIGSRWSIIASQLPGRTDNDIKNYWNTRLKKKLLRKQRKELQEARLNQELQLTENRTDTYFQTSQSARTNFGTGIIMKNNNNNPPQQQQTLYFPQMQEEVPNFFSYRAVTLTDGIQEPGIKIEDGTSTDYNNQIFSSQENLGLIQNNQIPSDFTFSSEDFRFAGTMNNNENSVMRSSTNSPLPDSRNNYNLVQGYNGDFPVEPGIEMVFNNFIPIFGKAETDNFFGTSNSAEQSTISWDEISSLVYHSSQKL